MTVTPADVPGGHTVKMRTRSQTWTTPPLAPAHAALLAEKLLGAVSGAGGGDRFIGFDCRDGRNVQVRAREIVSIEHGPTDQGAQHGGTAGAEPARPTDRTAAAGTDWLRSVRDSIGASR